MADTQQRTGASKPTSGRVVRRRNNAPVRGRPEHVPWLPDPLFAVSLTCFTLASVLFWATFMDEGVIAGEAGRDLARLLAGLTVAVALLTLLMAVALVLPDRSRSDHYVVPFIVGMSVGAAVSLLLLSDKGQLALVPFPFLLISLRPIRRLIGYAIPHPG
jgi:ABC-type transport system involved in cytochrome c biogenesis permease subunit